MANFFRPVKPTRFEYRPRYFDPAKEELEAKKARRQKIINAGKGSLRSEASGKADHLDEFQSKFQARVAHRHSASDLRVVLIRMMVIMALAIAGMILVYWNEIQAALDSVFGSKEMKVEIVSWCLGVLVVMYLAFRFSKFIQPKKRKSPRNRH